MADEVDNFVGYKSLYFQIWTEAAHLKKNGRKSEKSVGIVEIRPLLHCGAIYRLYMDRDKSWISLPRHDRRYTTGVVDFLQFVEENANGNEYHYCPCKKCKCRSDMCRFPIRTVWEHLKSNGFWPKYKRWIYHGEPSLDGSHDHGQFFEAGSSSTSNDPTMAFVNDVFPFESGVRGEQYMHDPVQPFPQVVNTAAFDKYNKLIALQQTPVSSSSEKTVLQSVMEVMRIKVETKSTIRQVDEYLQYTSSLLEEGHRNPTNHRKVRSILKDLGLSYIKIHACAFDCVLFWGKDAEGNDLASLDACPICQSDRYKLTGAGNRKPVKVLRYFPLRDRLERLYMSETTAKAMRWHGERDAGDADIMTHISDGAAWKHINNEFPHFASDVRNVRLGLSTDGFNPFGTMSLSYSIWPVVLVPYNLPPWMCMKKEYNMLTLLIPGPGYPGKCLDVYMRPLIEELKVLWDVGHPTFDKYKEETFQMHAMVIGTISDFPAYGMLSGSVVRGYKACPECLSDYGSTPHCNKICRMGHRVFLPADHHWRYESAAFDGTEEHGGPPRRWTGREILAVLNEYDFGPLSNHPDIVAEIPERPEEYKFWTHKSILWELPYWCELLIRHFLDVMHIEKNVSESVVGTTLNLEGKTKDGPKARTDLQNMNIRKQLWLKQGKRKMPQAPYTVKPEHKSEIFHWISRAKYPSGFAGNIAKCVNRQFNNLYGLKSHDNHILLQRLFPVFIRPFLPRHVVEPLVALARFFQKVCTREVRKSDLREMQQDIVHIMCKFEMIFPPNFFDIMPHLMIHLPRQLLLTGPVHFTWMYPMERQLGQYGDFVQNRSAPEGCIAEAYIAHECVTYMKLYLGALQESIPEDVPSQFNLSILSDDVVLGGNMPVSYKLKDYEVAIAHWWVLINCLEVQFWKNMHLNCEQVGGDLDYHNRTFAEYFGRWMDLIKNDNHPNWSHELRLLAMKPVYSKVYATCKVNGVLFRCEERDVRLKTQNSGVMAHGGDDGVDYYGVLHSVVELHYGEGMKVHLFKCRWFDTRPQSMKTDQYGITSVNTSTSWYEDDPFVLATWVKQVFYLDDLAKGDPWKVVNTIHHRNIYRASTLGVAEENEEGGTAYQEPNSNGIPDSSFIRLDTPVRIRREEPLLVDVDPNEETNEDSSGEERHRLPLSSNSETEEDSSDDSDYNPTD